MYSQYNELVINPEFESLLAGEDEFEWLQEMESTEYETSDAYARFTSMPAVANYLKAKNEVMAVKAAIQAGMTNENELASLLFFYRHPELGWQKLVKGQANFDRLSKEWIDVRDRIVRPALAGGGAIPSTPVDPSNPNMPPVEGPLKGITGYRGTSGKKCWNKAKSADIIDADAPWNKPDNRSAANYIAVLDYLNVGEASPGNTFNKPSENPRYRQQRNDRGGISTYCNIYVHDATRAMWASVPHWVKMGSAGKFNELSANTTADWLSKNGKSIGWHLIDGNLLNNRNSFPRNIAVAATQVANRPPEAPSLLQQPGYLAQQFANAGLPTIIVYKNAGGIGHVAMVRPEQPPLKVKKIESGICRPRSSQAGAKNFSDDLTVFGASSIKGGKVSFYVHE